MSAILESIKIMLISILTVLAGLFIPADTVVSPPVITSTATGATTSISAVVSKTEELAVKTSASSTPVKRDQPKNPPRPNTKELPTQPPKTESVPQPIITPPQWDAINIKLRDATVNIICTSASGGLVNPLSASGILIDPRGIILTNAHVAQYFLIKDYPIKNFLECGIRQGSPASMRYRAELLYVSPTWVRAHYKEILEQNPVGTGESDFALLRITGPSGPSIQVPATFPSVEPTLLTSSDLIGHPALIAAYPAGFLGGISIQNNLYLSSAPVTVKDVYTFADTSVDLVSLGGTVVAQHGSSGGGVTLSDGKLLGIVVTSSEGQTTGERNLRAITMSYINRVLLTEIHVSLSELLAANPEETAAAFQRDAVPDLSKLYEKVLSASTK